MALTTSERTNIIKLVVAMFNAAPGASYLMDLTAVYEANGRSLQNLATDLSNTSAYKAINPTFQTADEFVQSLLTPLGLQANTTAVDFVTAQFNAGVSKGQIAYNVAVALHATTDSQFAASKALLDNKTIVAEYYSVQKAISQVNIGTLQLALALVTKDLSSVAVAEKAIDDGSYLHPPVTPTSGGTGGTGGTSTGGTTTGSTGSTGSGITTTTTPTTTTTTTTTTTPGGTTTTPDTSPDYYPADDPPPAGSGSSGGGGDPSSDPWSDSEHMGPPPPPPPDPMDPMDPMGLDLDPAFDLAGGAGVMLVGLAGLDFVGHVDPVFA